LTKSPLGCILKKGVMGDLTENFSRSEFTCKCGCGFDDISLELVNELQTFRNLLWITTGKPHKIRIESGCRCVPHNKSVGGATNSAHLYGWASDIKFGVVAVNVAARIAYLSTRLGISRFRGIGLYKGKKSMHLDIRFREVRTTPMTWIDKKYGVDFSQFQWEHE